MKFSVRDLLFVTVIVAVAGGWFVNRQQWIGLEQYRRSLAAKWFRSAEAENGTF